MPETMALQVDINWVNLLPRSSSYYTLVKSVCHNALDDLRSSASLSIIALP
jgi:hypothetical protein